MKLSLQRMQKVLLVMETDIDPRVNLHPAALDPTMQDCKRKKAKGRKLPIIIDRNTRICTQNMGSTRSKVDFTVLYVCTCHVHVHASPVQ